MKAVTLSDITERQRPLTVRTDAFPRIIYDKDTDVIIIVRDHVVTHGAGGGINV